MTVDDEPFWRQQERRRERRLGQPCCTQSGFSWTLIDMPGRFAVVIHGEPDCANCFHHHNGRSAAQYFSTRLSDAQLTSGDTEQPLRDCLQGIANSGEADVVVVLGTCPVEVIGDRFEVVVDEVSAATGLPMVALRTHGLALKAQHEMLDWCFNTLASLGPAAPNPDPAQVALIGLPPGDEAPDLLTAAGLGVRGFPEDASMEDWRNLGMAGHVFCTDPSLFPRLLGRLRRWGQQIHDVPVPIGLSASLQLYQAVEAASGLRLASASLHATAAQAVAAFRARHAGKRVALTTRMRNSYNTAVVARHGLGQLSALVELGLEVELLVQGAPDPEVARAYRAQLDAVGVSTPLRVFPGPYALAELLAAGDYQLASVADHALHAAAQADVPAIDTLALRPYLGAVPTNLALLERRLR